MIREPERQPDKKATDADIINVETKPEVRNAGEETGERSDTLVGQSRLSKPGGLETQPHRSENGR